MKPFSFTIALLVALSLPKTTWAENKLESWYTYWGLGYANSKYADETQDFLDDLESNPDVTHTPFGGDFLGFYWPQGEQTLIGGIINAAADIYEQGDVQADLSTFMLSVSMMHFVQKRIGQGPFVRSDLGAARRVFEVEIGRLSATDASDWGAGVLVGGGYGFAVAAGTRILVQASVAARRIGGENNTTLAITVGGLF